MKALLQGFGIRLLSVSENLDDSSTGKLLENIVAAFSQYDNDARSDRTKIGMRAAAEAGRYPFKPPLGYKRGTRKNGPSLIPDAEVAPLIRQAFEMVAGDGRSVSEVLRRMHVLGLRTATGKRMNKQSFHQTLRKPVYKGWIVSVAPGWETFKPVRGNFDEIVPEEIFDRVQTILSKGKGSTKEHKCEHPDFPLRRFVKCGRCDRGLTGSWSKGRKNRHAYYHCYRCSRSNVRKDVLEASFAKLLANLSPNPDLLSLFEDVVVDAWNEKHQEAIANLAVHQGKLEELQQRRDQLDEAYLYSKAIDADTYKRHRDKLAIEITAQNIAISDLSIEEFDAGSVVAYARNLLENAQSLWLEASAEQRQKLQRVFFPNGVTYRNGELGTTVTGPIFSFLSSNADREIAKATRHGLEP